ncbi:MAG: chemotaxis protein CheW [Gammaproteobacteria bacterium]|nr:chemotaxis protein CheW [Gammaproteobacteria bacterium]
MSTEQDELYSLLIPLSDDRLIVPRACVAEVVRFTKPEQALGSKDWLLGNLNWNGRELPVVAFEGTIDKELPAMTGRTRVVVFYAGARKVQSGFFGILTQGFPQLVRVNKDVLRLDTADGWGSDAPVLCRVKMINEYPLVPHLEKLEDMIATEMIQA